MCGIAGLLQPGLVPSEGSQVVERMLARLQHRGPDGQGLAVLGEAVLGHTRLAVMDLVGGQQPLSDDTGTISVVANGEIYNHCELREELEAHGHVLRTQCDMEVLPHLYRLHGDDFIEHLRGMFAFALYDHPRRRLLLVRDRLGKKPLFWTRRAAGLAFASELRALCALPDLDLQPDPQALDLFLSYQYVPAPWSILKQVKKLPAATMLVLEDGRVHARRYWDALPEADEALTADALQEQLAATLEEATRLRLRSDVPVGVFLSGGIDSGLVASCISEGQVRCALTVGFPGSPEDERSLTRATARSLGLTLEERELPLDPAHLIPEVLSDMDEPLGDSSAIPTWLLCRAAAQGLKVVLSGDGGDESFAGYAERYWQSYMVERARRVIPGFLRRPLAGFLADVLPKGDGLPRWLRWKCVLRSLSVDLGQACFLDRSVVRPSLKARLYRPSFQETLDGFEAAGIVREPLARAGCADPVASLLYVDRHTWLAEGVLAKVDRCSMANSLEVRSPLLDQELVALAARVPTALMLRGRVGKVCLRRLAQERLPGPVSQAPKSGFAPPLAAWLRGPLAADVEGALGASDSWIGGILEREVMQDLLREHATRRRDWSRQLWLLYVLETWAQQQQAGPLS